MITEPGIYAGVRFEDYLADPCPAPSLSSSIASILCSSTPAHARYRHPRLNPTGAREEAEHFDIGSCAHAIVLEGINKVQILEFDDYRTKAARAARDAARLAGRIPLLAKIWADVEAMVNTLMDSLEQHRDGRLMFRDGQAEQTLVWYESIYAIWCRARPDFLRLNLDSHLTAIDDYKTTRASANPDALARTAFAHGWDIQAALYKRGLQVLTGRLYSESEFRFAVQECFPPYAVSVVALGPQIEMLAEKKLRYAMDLWGRCLASNRWPSYADRTAYLTLPPWIESAWLEKEEADAV